MQTPPRRKASCAGIKDRTFLLLGDSMNHCITVPPWMHLHSRNLVTSPSVAHDDELVTVYYCWFPSDCLWLLLSLQLIDSLSLFSLQTLMSVRTLTPVARSASTTRGILSVNAMKVMRWILSLKPARQRVSYSDQQCSQVQGRIIKQKNYRSVFNQSLLFWGVS